MPTCNRCGRAATDDASFCAGCGAPLTAPAAREERKVDLQLAKALAFYRSVGATRLVRKAESLLAATA